MSSNLHSSLFTTHLRSQLCLLAIADKKKGAEAYLKNQFVFIGVDTTNRRKVLKGYVVENGLPPYEHLPALLTEMFQLEREMQYCAIEIAAQYKKYWQNNFIEIIETLIITNSWWDTVDAIASMLTSVYFKKYPDQILGITGRWNKSGNLWLQRSSLLFQLKYKQQMNTELLAQYIRQLCASNEFFVQKAIGWILREYAKTDAKWVIEFVSLHKLKPLSKREALKHLSS